MKKLLLVLILFLLVFKLSAKPQMTAFEAVGGSGMIYTSDGEEYVWDQFNKWTKQNKNFKVISFDFESEMYSDGKGIRHILVVFYDDGK